MTSWLLFLLSIAVATSAQAEPARPNIVLLISDDHDYEHFGFMGTPYVRTPNLDALAAAGVVFTTAHLPAPTCRPSLASFLSGRWPHQTGIYANLIGVEGWGPDTVTLDPTHSLPRLLRDAGYRTFGDGKYWEGDPREMGFTDGPLQPMDYMKFMHFVREDQNALFHFLDETAGKQPFFLWWAPMLPHTPHTAPERHLSAYTDVTIPVPSWARKKRKKYRAETRRLLANVTWMDEGVGQLVAKLKAAGVYDDTLFVFLSDNGWSIGSPSKMTPYEKGLRTPMVFSFPGRIAKGRRFEELVSTIDLYPTLLDYAGAAIPEGTAGRSLRPVLEGRVPPTAITAMGAVYGQVASNGGKNPADDVVALYVRDAEFKFVYYVRALRPPRDAWIHIRDVPSIPAGTTQLFNLGRDPYERFNVAGFEKHEERLARYRAQVSTWWTATGGGPLPGIGATPDGKGAPSS